MKHVSYKQTVFRCSEYSSQKLEFEVNELFMFGSPLSLVLAYRKIATADDKASTQISLMLSPQLYAVQQGTSSNPILWLSISVMQFTGVSKMAPCQVTQLILVRNAVKTFSKCHYFSCKWTFPILCHKQELLLKTLVSAFSKWGETFPSLINTITNIVIGFLEGKYWYLSPFEMYQSVLILFRHPICVYPKNFKDLFISNTFTLEGV